MYTSTYPQLDSVRSSGAEIKEPERSSATPLTPTLNTKGLTLEIQSPLNHSSSDDDKDSHYASGKRKNKPNIIDKKGNKLRYQRKANQNVAIVQSLQNEVNKLSGEKDAMIQMSRDSKTDKKDELETISHKEEEELVRSQRSDIPSIRIVRSPLEDWLPVKMILGTMAASVVPLLFFRPERGVKHTLKVLASIAGINLIGRTTASIIRRWMAPPPYTELLPTPPPEEMTVAQIIANAYLRPTPKPVLTTLTELFLGAGAYTDIKVIGHYTTQRKTDSRMVADRPCRVNLLPQTLTVLEIENPFYIKRVVALNELVLQLAVKNTHKEIVDFMAKVRADNRNAAQFNLTPIERALVCSYTPQVASLINEVMKINSHHLVSGNGLQLDF
jgi:hypothetical protein